MPKHRWTGQQTGGPPDMAESTEWVCYCKSCGTERTEDNEEEACTMVDVAELRKRFEQMFNGQGGLRPSPAQLVEFVGEMLIWIEDADAQLKRLQQSADRADLHTMKFWKF